MKTISRITYFLFAVLFTALLASCSEFMLIPISFDYPFDKKNEEASPTTYKINVNEGLKSIEKIFNSEVRNIVDKSSAELKQQGAEITYPEFGTEDIIELLSGETIEKEWGYNLTLQDGTNKSETDKMPFSICDFQNSAFEKEGGSELEFKNIVNFCDKSETERNEIVEKCKETIDEKKCLFLEVRQENESLAIKMAEQKDLKKYKKYLNKIYSATLNDLTFTIKNPLSINPGQQSFKLKADLYAQPIDPFKPNGEPCKDGDDLKICIYKGVDENGEPEDYFTATIKDDSSTDESEEKTKEKYLIGTFKTEDDTYSSDQIMNLHYTYEGKDILQHAIKHLDFQLGIKSYYIFYPQAMKPEGTLEASIKAKLLFNVEPLN